MNAQRHTWEREAVEVRKHYEEILTSLDYTFGEIKEIAEDLLHPEKFNNVEKKLKNIIGLIDARSKY